MANNKKNSQINKSVSSEFLFHMKLVTICIILFFVFSETSYPSTNFALSHSDKSGYFDEANSAGKKVEVSLNDPNYNSKKSDVHLQTHRTLIHTEAYKSRSQLGPHLNFKITPPEKRGRKGRVLVEVYNFSKVNFTVISFWMVLSNSWGDRIEVEISCDDILSGWSALKWVKIPGGGKIPEITNVQIYNFKAFNDQGKEVKMKYTTDLIKK